MPLKAVFNTENIFSFQYSESEWKELKREYKKQSLVTHCCSTPAIPKVSQNGLQFFAHKAKASSNCNYKPEGPKHEYVKFVVAKAAHEAGWDVQTEARGTIDGEGWVADVYCKKGKAVVVYEIQNSKITQIEIERRQLKYTKSGIRCAWIVDLDKFSSLEGVMVPSDETPVFAYYLDSLDDMPIIRDFHVGLDVFIKGMLSKKLKWVTEKSLADLTILHHECWKCYKKITSPLGLSDDALDNGSDISASLNKVWRMVSLDYLKENGVDSVNKVKYRNGAEYFSPVCIHCSASQGVHQLSKILWNTVNTYSKNHMDYGFSWEIIEVPFKDPAFKMEIAGHWEFEGHKMMVMKKSY